MVEVEAIRVAVEVAAEAEAEGNQGSEEKEAEDKSRSPSEPSYFWHKIDPEPGSAGKQVTDALATHPEICLNEPQPEEFGVKNWQKNQEAPSRNVKRRKSGNRNKKIRERADSKSSSTKPMQSQSLAVKTRISTAFNPALSLCRSHGVKTAMMRNSPVAGTQRKALYYTVSNAQVIFVRRIWK